MLPPPRPLGTAFLPGSAVPRSVPASCRNASSEELKLTKITGSAGRQLLQQLSFLEKLTKSVNSAKRDGYWHFSGSVARGGGRGGTIRGLCVGGGCTVAPFERFRALSQLLSKPLVPLSALICNRTRGIWFSYEGWNTGDAVCLLLPRAIHLGPASQKKNPEHTPVPERH